MNKQIRTSDEKLDIIETVFDGKTPAYMWYRTGRFWGKADNDWREVIRTQAKTPGDSGDVEFYKPWFFGTCDIRVRDAKKTLSQLNLGNRVAELFKVYGQPAQPAYIPHVDFDNGVITANSDKREYAESKGLRFIRSNRPVNTNKWSYA